MINFKINVEDEVSLREIIETLEKYKRLIFMPAFVAIIVTYVYFGYIAPRVYQATALVTVDQPAATFEWQTSFISPLTFSSSFLSNMSSYIWFPNETLIAGIALSEEIIQAVYETADTDSRPIPVGDIQYSVNSTYENNRIRVELFVNGPDSDTVAAFTAKWAELVSDEVRKIFVDMSRGSVFVDKIKAKVEYTYQQWMSDQEILEEHISQGQEDVLDARLDQAKAILDTYLEQERDNDNDDDLANRIEDIEAQINTLVVELEAERNQLAQYTWSRDFSRDTYLVSAEELEILHYIQDRVGNETVVNSTTYPPRSVNNSAFQIAAGAGVSVMVISILAALAIEWWRRSTTDRVT